MNKVYAVGIMAVLVCIVGIELATAQSFPVVDNEYESQEAIKELSIAELNNFVDPVTLKVQEMKTLGMNDTEIVEALNPLGMGYYPETGATWIGRTPSPEELQNLPPRRYLFKDVAPSQLTAASEAEQKCQLMGTGVENTNYNGFSNYMMPGSLAVEEKGSYWHLATTHIGRGGHWTEAGVIRGAYPPSTWSIFTYDDDEGGYVFHGTTNQSTYTQYLGEQYS